MTDNKKTSGDEDDLVNPDDLKTAKELAALENMTEEELDAKLRLHGCDIEAINQRLIADEEAAELLRKLEPKKRGDKLILG